MSGGVKPVIIGLRALETRDVTLPLPSQASAGAAGLDLRANLPLDERGAGRCLTPGARTLVPTGLALAIPEGFEVQVRPRSGLALRHGVTLLNSPGTIDSDYRGEIGVIVVNFGDKPFTIDHGMRIAQMVAAPVASVRFEMRMALDDTGRGAGGFGSTGTHDVAGAGT